jgi:O-antigen biosynthesis protein
MTPSPRDGLGRRLLEARGRAADRLRTSREQREEVRRIRASGLFDDAFYTRHHPDVVRPGRDPLRHFVVHGWREGRQPHPLFDMAYYASANAGAGPAARNPLLHFIDGGWRERRNPHPLFDTAWYLQANPDVVGAGINPLAHYWAAGWREGRSPHPLFDAAWYLQTHPDVAGAGLHPLTHYLTVGWRQGRDPHPLFDTAWYLHANPDVARSGENPLAHFVTVGWREGRDPHPLFSVTHYLERHPEAAAAGVNPLVAFVEGGWRAGRDPHPLFDVEHYLGLDPPLARQPMDPLSHFVQVGMAEGRRPFAGFDPEMPLPLPEFAWEPGRSRVEQVLRTFVRGRVVPLDAERRQRFVREINARAETPGRLVRPDAPAVPDVSVIVPVFNQVKFTLWCLHALLGAGGRRTFEVIVVDDASEDATAEVLAQIPAVRHLRAPRNQGFVHSCNLGAQRASGDVLVFLNNDTLPQEGWLDALLDTLRDHPEAALAGAKLVYPDGRLQEAGGIVWQSGAAWNYGRGGDRHRPEFNYLRSVDYCSGAALAVRAELFRQAGGFDVTLAPGYGEDVDLALRLRDSGWTVLYQPLSEVVHLEGATGGTSTRQGAKAHQVRNLERLAERWRLVLRGHRPEGAEPRLEKDRDAQRRVLFVDSFTPRPDQDAGSLDALHWMQALTALGFQVTFVPYRDLRHAGRYTSDLQRQGIECILAPAWTSAQDLLAAHGAEFDLCAFYRYEAADALMPAVRRHAPQARRLLGVCDLAHVRTARRAELSGSSREAREAREIRLRELLACAESDAVWTPSRWEQDLLLKELPETDVFVSPLVQDVRPPAAPYGQRCGLGFIGGYRHAPNVDAVLFFVREVLPHVLQEEPEMKLHVAGSHMPPEIASISHPAVRVLGQVDDLRAFFEKVRVFVAPIRFGAGVKGKVAAAFGAGVPVVGTTLALEGMGLEPEEGALAADDPREMAREIVRLYRGEPLWNRLSKAGLERARREYSPASGTRTVARAVERLGVATRGAREYLERWGDACARPSSWPHVPGVEVDVCRGREDYRALRGGPTAARRAGLEQRLLADAGPAVALRAWSVPAQKPVVYRADVGLDRDGRRTARWREELICPLTRLNNRQRGIAAFAQGLLLDPEAGVEEVYLSEQVTPLFAWLTRRFRTVRITGSEYLGPEVPAGTVRDGIVHQDLEKMGLPSASVDLVLSCDVLEHVNEPRAALAEVARVLRPGGHLLFTVPFSSHRQENVRRARFKDGAVEHLLEPSYHGNPIDEKGALAYFDYGWELLDWVREAGFAEVEVLCFWSVALGHLGVLEAFHARR